jgi:hypothetical protein
MQAYFPHKGEITPELAFSVLGADGWITLKLITGTDCEDTKWN